MPTAVCDGIETYYEIYGSGPPLLMLSPGGFNGALENWRTFGIYKRLRLLDHLPVHYTCIAFDKRESGRSGGRVEPLTWDRYAKQAAELLDHLELERVHVMGGCIGCSVATEFAVAYPGRARSMVLYSPAGGPKYRLTQTSRFAEHVTYVDEHGLARVVALARSDDKSFAQDPRVGPWVGTIRSDAHFADAYANWDLDEYRRLVKMTAELLFDRETTPGPEAAELMKLEIPSLVVPGNDANHAISAARYLEECLPHSEYWDVPVEDRTEATAPARILQFLQMSDSPRSSAAI
jgi:pimeloyl-ACP methyl ester carboxylesterase